MIQLPTSSQTLQSMLNRMVLTTPINAVSPGSIARSFLEVINTELQTCYSSLDFSMAQCFLSTATGTGLDSLGELVNCPRRINEPDSNYRFRIKSSSLAKSTETSIRLECLSVDGVNNVTIQKYSHGIGSFSVFVLTDSLEPTQATMSKIQAIIDKYEAPGIKGVATYPTKLNVSLMIYVSLSDDKNKTQVEALKKETTSKIKSVVDALDMGGTLQPYEVINQILTSKDVKTATISSVYINGEKQSGVNPVYAKWNEKIVLDSINYLI